MREKKGLSKEGECGIIRKDYRLAAQSLSEKGGDAMNYVTYSDLFQFGILIVAIIALCKTGDK